MEDLKLQQLQMRVIREVMELTTDAINSTATTRIGELNSLHVAANMDITKTTKGLNAILTYKKELALRMLQCSDVKQMKYIAEAIKEADDMIKKILGIGF